MTDHQLVGKKVGRHVSTSTILEHVCLSGKGEDDNVIMVMLTINDPEIHKII